MKNCSQGHPNSDDAIFCTICREFIFIKRRRVWLLSFLNFVTYGMYIPVWFLIIRKSINSLQSNEKLGIVSLIFIFVVLNIGLVLNIFAIGMESSVSINVGINILIKERFLYYPYKEYLKLSHFWIIDSIFLQFVFFMILIGFVIILVQTFKTRRILDFHFNHILKRNIKFSVIGTFFFNIMYLQYKINRLN